ASLERGSEHPLASAIVAGAEARGISLETATEFQSTTGRGVVGRVAGHRIALGNELFARDLGADPSPLLSRLEALRKDGETAVVVVVDGQTAGVLSVADPIKTSTVEAIRSLQKDGVRIVMLTGDHRTSAEAVARRLGIDDVTADLRPD